MLLRYDLDSEEIEFSTLLDFPTPKLRHNSVETVIAEKTLTIIELGSTNSRMKDYFDLLHLSRTRSLAGAMLAKALRATADRRGVAIPVGQPAGLTPEFGANAAKRKQWAASVKRTRGVDELGDLGEVVQELAEILGPVVEAAAARARFAKRWSSTASWSEEARGGLEG